jgi:hypothetical protein
MRCILSFTLTKEHDMADPTTMAALAAPAAADTAAKTGIAAAPATQAVGGAAPAVKAGGAVAGTAAKTGITGTVLATAKTAALSPMVGVIALGGIIVFEWWKGSRDARKFSSAA